MCNACQHINFKKRDACQNCGYPKIGGPDPETYRYNWTETLAGDWYCSGMNCGAHNYASRTSCYRCGTLKNGYSCGFGGNMDASGGYGSDCNYPPGWKTGDWICTRYFHIITYFVINFTKICCIFMYWSCFANCNYKPNISIIRLGKRRFFFFWRS